MTVEPANDDDAPEENGKDVDAASLAGANSPSALTHNVQTHCLPQPISPAMTSPSPSLTGPDLATPLRVLSPLSQVTQGATTLDSVYDSDAPEEDEEDGDAASPAGAFYARWAPDILNCSSREELDVVTACCAADWHKRTKKDDQPNKPVHRPPNPPPSDVPRRRRQQSRQQQRVRRQDNVKRRAERSKIQILFKRYPRRAVRKVLGESSPQFSGSTEVATLLLKRAYEQLRPTAAAVLQARVTYDDCQWAVPSADEFNMLASPPSRMEIVRKLKRASNTSPGADGVEYKDISRLDPECYLLEVLYSAVWRLGVPSCWKSARTIPIHKKGPTEDYGNFRPISLLSTLYKLFSSSIASRLTMVASNNEWLSPEQKGFLPGVHGIQEHTMLLQSAIEEAKLRKRVLTICWLDLANAFGSLPHDFLNQLFDSLPVPPVLREILTDIYRENIFQFVVGQELVTIKPTTGVRQGDGLSSIIFNLAAEPLVRCAKAQANGGFMLFNSSLKTTAYADDIALVGTDASSLQPTIDEMMRMASKLGLCFNVEKCSSITITKGKATPSEHLHINGVQIRSLEEGENELYLGVPMGTRLTFRPATDLPEKLTKVADSDLAPWQKLEVFRAHLLPSLSHHLATGRVERTVLRELDTRCAEFLRLVAEVPHSAHNGFLYGDRRAGGLGASQLIKDSDVWTIARAVQLLDSKDLVVRTTARAQLAQNISRGFRGAPPDPLPLSDYISGSTQGGLHDTRFYKVGPNTWTRTRKAARRLEVRIDVSSDETLSKVIADDISCLSVKAVRGLRSIIRSRWTNSLAGAPNQGRVARGLLLDKSNDIARLTSYRTSLSFEEWGLIHKSRLCILPLLGTAGLSAPDNRCRRCKEGAETTSHVVSHCRINLPALGRRHDAILEHLVKVIRKAGHSATVNKVFPGTILRPDIVINTTTPHIIIDLTVTFDAPESLLAGYEGKVAKYGHLGTTLPVVIGALGSWLPANNIVAASLGIRPKSWCCFRRNSRLMAIQASMRVVSRHLRGTEDDETGPEP